MKTAYPKPRKAAAANLNFSVLYGLNPHLLAIVMVYYLLSVKLPGGQSSGKALLLLALLLSVFATGLLNDLYKPKTIRDTFGKKATFKKNQVFFVRSVCIAVAVVAAILFFFLKDMWLFAALLTICSFAYIHLFNNTLPDQHFAPARLFCGSSLLMVSAFGSNWVAQSPDTESWLGFALSVLVIWQNGLVRSDFGGNISNTKKDETEGNFRLVRGITVLIIVIGILACYKSGYRFSQRFFTILMLTAIAQDVCLWRSDIFSKNRYIQLTVRLLPLLPVTIL